MRIFLPQDASHSAEFVAQPVRNLRLELHRIGQLLLHVCDLQVPVRIATDELHGHIGLPASAPDAAFDDEQRSSLLDDFRYGLAGTRKGRGTGYDFEIRKSREIGYEGLGYALAEIAGRIVTGKILKRKNDYYGNALIHQSGHRIDRGGRRVS